MPCFTLSFEPIQYTSFQRNASSSETRKPSHSWKENHHVEWLPQVLR
jgi:hypothetical protein